jgi:uncharacterized protein YjbJ (UPF0337 family)
VKGRSKSSGVKLTDDDLNVMNGKQDQLEGEIQERYGYAKDQVCREIDDWYNSQKKMTAQRPYCPVCLVELPLVDHKPCTTGEICHDSTVPGRNS